MQREPIEDEPGSGGGSRRSFLTKVGVGAAAAWTAPVLLSSPASAGPGTACASCGQLVAGGTGTAADLASWALTGDSNAISSGNQFRAGGSVFDDSVMTQVIELSGVCDNLPAVLSASLRSSLASASTVVATWFDGAGATGTNLGTMNIASNSTTFTTFTDNDVVPSGAQSVRVVIQMTRSLTTGTSGGSDNITLTLC